jgi:quercetin dioxygenase-like cupin family protein
MSANLTDSQLAEVGVGVAHHFGGKAYVKETFIAAGLELTQHAHDHDHLAYLVSGQAVLQVDDEAHTISAPAPLLLKAGTVHGVKALTDVVWLCIWSTECTDPSLVDEAVEAGR